jgi:Amt family ammonium transporter
MFLSWFYHRPTVSGIATGAVAGLVAITPAAGFVSPIMGIPIGIGVALVCFFMMRLRNKTKIDESLMCGLAMAWEALGQSYRYICQLGSCPVD